MPRAARGASFDAVCGLATDRTPKARRLCDQHVAIERVENAFGGVSDQNATGS
jgi:hypothetical protein